MTAIDLAAYNELWDCKIILPPDRTRNARKAYGNDMLAMARDAFRNHEIMSEGEGRWTIAHKYTDPGKWFGKWRSDFLAEIIVCRVGVFVSGDIDIVVFAGGDSNMTPEGMVGWVGRHRDVDSYLLGKASIGFCASNRNPAESFDEDTAIDQMQDRAFEVYQTICEQVVEEYNDGNESWILPVIPRDDDHFIEAKFNYETGKTECEDEAVLQKLLMVVSQKIEANKELEAWATAIAHLRRGDAHEEVVHELYDDLSDADVCDVGELVCDLGTVAAPRVYYAHAACVRLCELLDAREVAVEDAP